jgi:hypothetical protein
LPGPINRELLEEIVEPEVGRLSAFEDIRRHELGIRVVGYGKSQRT